MSKYIQRVQLGHIRRMALVTGGGRSLEQAQSPTEYYTSKYSGEEIDNAVGNVLNGNIAIPSSTSGSAKKFKISVDDSGAITATEVTQCAA